MFRLSEFFFPVVVAAAAVFAAPAVLDLDVVIQVGGTGQDDLGQTGDFAVGILTANYHLLDPIEIAAVGFDAVVVEGKERRHVAVEGNTREDNDFGDTTAVRQSPEPAVDIPGVGGILVAGILIALGVGSLIEDAEDMKKVQG